MAKKLNNNWYEVSNQTGLPELLVYGYIGQYEEVDFLSFKAALQDIAKTSTTLKVRIHSGGGSVLDGLPIYDALVTSGLDITVVIDGLAASMASVISQAASKGKRQIHESGNLMIHRVKGAQFGNADDLRAYADMVDDLEKRIKQIFIKSTGQTTEVVNTWFSKGVDFWINAENALTLGLVDEIITGENNATALPTNVLQQMGERKAYEAITNQMPTPNLKTLEPDMNKLQTLLMAALAVRGISLADNATEEQTLNHVQNAFKKADDRIKELEQLIATNVENQADALVNSAEVAGKFKKDDTEGKAELRALAIVNFSMASKMVDRLPGTVVAPKNVTVNIGTTEGAAPAGGNVRAAWSFEEWSKKDSKGLAAMQTKEPENFAKLYEAEYGQVYSA